VTTAGHILRANTSVAEVGSSRMSFPLLVGFFFAFRSCISYLGFQSDPRTGAAVSLGCSGLLLIAALFQTMGDEHFSMRLMFASRTLRWLWLYLAVTGLSVLWTAAESPAVAAGFWAGMVMDAVTAVLLVKPPDIAKSTDALMKGFVVGTLFVAAVAWLSPTLPDLRIGNEEFLHPNWLGLICGLAFFFAQHLASEERGWKWCCLALGVTLLRSISKTSIVAFFIAEGLYLSREKQLTTRAKAGIAAVLAIVAAAFWNLLGTYFENYSMAGNSTETLTGRTFIWAMALSAGIERPWFGHGLYSYRALIPAVGTFEPAHAHNEILQQFFEFGLLGVSVTVGLYLSLFLAAKRSASLRFGKLVQVLVIFCAIRGLADTLNFGLSLPLWLFAALALALAKPQEGLEASAA
jgi:exopolysaccharide production protein ExoQ